MPPPARICGSFLVLWLNSCTFALAGGGPEGVLLVVNPKSPASLTIANHYTRLRQIPPNNLLYLPWDPGVQTTDVDTFRRQLLLPALQAIEKRHLAGQIDYVVYSSDFPWGIKLDSDIRKFHEAMQKLASEHGNAEDATKDEKAAEPQWPKHLTPVGSLTGLTYLWQAALVGHPAYLQLQNNHYAQSPILGHGDSSGFRGSRRYGPPIEGLTSGSQRYFLSTMLGVTAGRGNSLGEVIRYLECSAAADATHPKGTIYFVRNGDIRSRKRHDLFSAAVGELSKLGVTAEIVDGTVPQNKIDVQGAMMGTANFDWKASGSTILPGAICEHFTSYGGVLSAGASQTPLSEFLRYGAAGSSGTVTEPYAVAEKFPSPMIQVHYARGCTLAEAFYQSVRGPYQLLIVGDPLCRPWADVPQVSVGGLKPGDTVRGTLMLKPTAILAQKAETGQRAQESSGVEVFELFADGRRLAHCRPGETLALDTTKLADGHHELRIVAVGAAPIESQGRQILPVVVDNHGRRIEVSLASKGPLRNEAPLLIVANSPGSIGIIAVQGSRIVGRIAGQKGQIEIPANTLGAGPVTVHLIGLGSGDASTNVMAQPLEFVLE